MAAISADELAFEQSLEVFSLSYVLPVMATISDLLVTRCQRVHTNLPDLLNTEGVNEAFGISLLSGLKARSYCVISYVIPVMAVIFDLSLTSMS